MTITLSTDLPAYPTFTEGIRRAPDRGYRLTPAQTETALRNALRYIPVELHEQLAPELMDELLTRGKIYGYRFRPEGDLKAKPIDEYKGNCIEGKAFQVMIDNNLSFDIALYPYELVTYGETGQVCQNWMQYRLIKQYLEVMTNEQTLVVESGHPLGLFKSHPEAPRVIITNSMMVGMFDNQKDWEIAAQMGVANYGQMTAGGWMYIGPQGIVHGTFNTLLNAGRMKLGVPQDGNLNGHLFVSSGLGGMSGAQPKAAEIAGAVAIIAEVDYSRIETRHRQGWVQHITSDLSEAYRLAADAIDRRIPCSIAYHGNVVNLLEYALHHNIHIELLSDQTSCHAVYEGGYCPAGISFEERTRMLKEDRETFDEMVNETLRRHFHVIKELVARGTYFFDYGNSFMKAIYDAGVKEISRNGTDEKDGFIWPSYVEDIMGPQLFDYGYGPFRWVCLSGKKEDLIKTDHAAMECIPKDRRGQDMDNWIWIRDAEKNNLVVGTQARILYQDALGRMNIALRFNEMVRRGEVGPIMLGRDHHDVSGTDSPFRETSNIKDGSNVMADMAVQCFAGNCARGMSLVALHNGGGVGIGKAINGGFGMVCDGSERVDRILRSSMLWDVMGGVARRSWARNPHAMETSAEFNESHADGYHITLPHIAEDDLINKVLKIKESTNQKPEHHGCNCFIHPHPWMFPINQILKSMSWTKIMECVPNFSEGRDLQKIDKIVSPFRAKAGVKLLDYSNDEDHNRLVVTVVGEPDALKEAVIEAIGIAVELIDLNHHQGQHPRMGAVDVVPFIPIKGCTMEDAIAVSKEVGQRVASQYNLPVFLYEKSASAPHRENLAAIRKGEFEGMKEKIHQPEWHPDFGTAERHPTAGTVAIGARMPLVAYNINLNTPSLEIAHDIAKKIRFIGGGLRYCKAMGVELKDRGITQVSMNLTDYSKTAIYRAFEWYVLKPNATE